MPVVDQPGWHHHQGGQNALGAQELTAQRGYRDPVLTTAEKRAEITLTDLIQDNVLPKFRMDNPLARLKLRFRH